MKIAKLMSHMGVDSMLHSALGDKLTIFRYNDPTGWAEDDDLPFPVVRGNIDPNIDWDIVIVDDMVTHQHIFSGPQLSVKQYVWYCHGTYDTWEGFQLYANTHFNDYAVIFTDYYKQSIVLNWAKFRIVDSITQNIFLPDQCFVPVSTTRNNKIFTVGNQFIPVCQIYYGFDHIVRPVLDTLQQLGPETYSHYGWPPAQCNYIQPEYFKGHVRLSELKDCNASIHPSGVRSVGFALLECLAAGIPVITTEKFDIPRSEHNNSIIMSFSSEDMLREANELLQDPEKATEMGKRGQEMAHRIFNKEKWVDNVVPWLENLQK